jgi:two-component system OmpR family response regulator
MMAGRVLLIEDEVNIAEAIRFLLTRDGWAVDTHADGASAMARIREVRPDILVLDVMLPGRSGYEILEDLRGDAGLADLPVLVLTARGQDRERTLAEARGASLFMTKPFANSEILENLRKLDGLRKQAGV